MSDRIWEFIFRHDSLDFTWRVPRFFITRWRILRTWWEPKERWCRSIKVGDWVEDCRGEVHVVERDGDDVILADGFHCSLWNCCCPPPGQYPSYWLEYEV
jgi:hypothetical protein